MWVTKLLISPVKKRIFCPKNDQIGPKIGIFGQFGPGHAGLFNALLMLWVSWWLWRAGCISQDTYLLYDNDDGDDVEDDHGEVLQSTVGWGT